ARGAPAGAAANGRPAGGRGAGGRDGRGGVAVGDIPPRLAAASARKRGDRAPRRAAGGPPRDGAHPRAHGRDRLPAGPAWRRGRLHRAARRTACAIAGAAARPLAFTPPPTPPPPPAPRGGAPP